LNVIESEDGVVGDGPLVLRGEGGEFGRNTTAELQEDVRGIEREQSFVVQTLLISGDGQRRGEGKVVAMAADDGGFEAEIFECDGEGGRETDDAR